MSKTSENKSYDIVTSRVIGKQPGQVAAKQSPPTEGEQDEADKDVTATRSRDSRRRGGIGHAADAHNTGSAATGDCPSGQTCIWRDASYVTNGSGTSLRGFGSYIPDYSTWSYAGTTINAGNNALSVYNNGNQQSVRIFDGANKGGSYFQLAIKTGDGNISNGSGYVQNKTWRPNSGYFAQYW